MTKMGHVVRASHAQAQDEDMQRAITITDGSTAVRKGMFSVSWPVDLAFDACECLSKWRRKHLSHDPAARIQRVWCK